MSVYVCVRESVCVHVRERGGREVGMERDRKKVQYLPLLVNGELVYLRKKKKK